MDRGTGVGSFIPADATRDELVHTIRDLLRDLHNFAQDTGRHLDLARVTINTRRDLDGRISVTVMADLSVVVADPSVVVD